MGYSDFGVYLGFRKLAGIRSVAPGMLFFDQTLGRNVYAVEKNAIIHLWGCEMASLMSDCIKISYSEDGNTYKVIKNCIAQNSFGFSGGHSPSEEPFYGYGEPSLKEKFQYDSDGFFINGISYGLECLPYGGMSRSSLLISKEKEIHFEVLMENFIRSFKFFVEGYYKIEFDETNSALYKSFSIERPSVYPEDYDYDSFRKKPIFPWSPVDPSSYEHGNLLIREIVLKCTSNFDAISKSFYSNETMTLDDNASDGLVLYTSKNICGISGLTVMPVQYSDQYSFERKNGFLIDINSPTVDSYVVDYFDKSGVFQKGMTVKNLRNRIFNSTAFIGPADFIRQIPYYYKNKLYVQPVDMRNSKFLNCKFTNIDFGSKDGKQISLDGSIFDGCEFDNCTISICCNNVMFKNCIVKNNNIKKGFAILGNSNGNAFIGTRVIETSNPFSFYGNSCSNLIAFSNVSSGFSGVNESSFLKVSATENHIGNFSGNVIIKNSINTSEGNPFVIDKLSAYGNLVAFNIINSFGSISISEEPFARSTPKVGKYESIAPYK